MRRREPLEASRNPYRDAVIQTPQLGEGAYCQGLRALTSSHRGRIITQQSQLLGSINVDTALRQTYPQQPRWDYGIGIQRDGDTAAIWVEFHPAETNKVDEVLSKVKWLKHWLRQNAPLLDALTPDQNAFHWVATNGCHIPRTSPQARRLFGEGLELPRRILNLDQLDL